MIDSERLNYASTLNLTRAYESARFQYAGVFDHFVPIYSDDDASVLECWTTIAALARDTMSLRVGPFVTCSAYRNPIIVSKMASTVCDMSDGRHFVGVGLGWYEREFEVLQIPEASFSQKLEQTEEFIHILRTLLNEETVSYHGKHYTFTHVSASEPHREKPIPILIGTEKGGNKMLKLVAKSADISNVGWNMKLEDLEEKLSQLDEECRSVGRDPASIVRSTNYDLLLGSSEKELEDRIKATEAKFRPRFGGMDAYRAKISSGLVGPPEQCAERIDRLKGIGIDLVFLQPLDSPSPDSVRLFAANVAH
jgi:alkanesulfonate monooxygenase SsuD/methylene tetrahydromethanopterin reductase-like flavin-dependent oxidoreductase (luciferase family)